MRLNSTQHLLSWHSSTVIHLCFPLSNQDIGSVLLSISCGFIYIVSWEATMEIVSSLRCLWMTWGTAAVIERQYGDKWTKYSTCCAICVHRIGICAEIYPQHKSFKKNRRPQEMTYVKWGEVGIILNYLVEQNDLSLRSSFRLSTIGSSNWGICSMLRV